VHVVSTVNVLPLGQTVAQVTWGYMFVVMRENVFETECWFEISVMCLQCYTDVGVFSGRSHQASAHMCNTRLLPYTHMLERSLGNKLTEKNCGK
jgi:hypothetical protein